MQTIHTAFLFAKLLHLEMLLFGCLRSDADESGKFRLEDYAYWLENHTINLVNYVAEVGMDVVIMSPITPVPAGLRWFSQNADGELSHPKDESVDLATSSYFEEFQETYNISWRNAFKHSILNLWLKIQKVHLGYADVFRVFVGESREGDEVRTEAQTFDVAITLMTFEKHECGFESKPQRPTKSDTFTLNCSVIVNGLWNASFVFYNKYGERETRGEISECDRQPNAGCKICSTVKVKAESDILAYSCRLEFPSNERQRPKNPVFQNSKWTDKFNKEVICILPKIYLEAIPSEVSFLCNNMPCGDTVLVNDTVTCLAHGFPQPVFELRIQAFSLGYENTSEDLSYEVHYHNQFFMDTDDDASEVEIRGSEDYRISQKDVGEVEISCYVSNALGWGYNSMVLEVKVEDKELPVAAAGEHESGNGIYIRCNGKICTNYEVMRIQDEISCDSDATRFESEVSIALKMNGVQITVQKPFLYKLQPEDIGEQVVQCIGHTEAGVSVSEITITVIDAHRYPNGEINSTADQPTIVILCNEHECEENETVEVTNTITCRLNISRPNEVVEMQLNGVTVGIAENSYTHKIVEPLNNGTQLFVVCNSSSHTNDTASVLLNFSMIGSHAASGRLGLAYDEEDVFSSDVDQSDDEKPKFRDETKFDDYFAELEHKLHSNDAVGGPKSFILLELFVIFFRIYFAQM